VLILKKAFKPQVEGQPLVFLLSLNQSFFYKFFKKKSKGTKYDPLGVVKCNYVFLFFAKTSGGAK